MAKEYLKNVDNRTVKPAEVKKFLKLMTNGEYLENIGNPITINWFGDLCDGQHRFHALVLANKSYSFSFQNGIDPEKYPAIDFGKPKRIPDFMKNSFGLNDIESKFAGNTLTFIDNIKRGKYGTARGSSGFSVDKIRFPELREWFANEREIFKIVFDTMGNLQIKAKANKTAAKNIFVRNELGGWIYFLSFYNFSSETYYNTILKNKAIEFLEKLYFVININFNSPIMKLREVLQDEKIKLSARRRYALIIKTMNAYWENETIGKLSFKDNEKMPDLIWGS